VWRFDDGEQIFKWYFDDNAIAMCLDFSFDGRYLVCCSSDQTVRIMNIENGSLYKRFYFSDLITYINYSPDGRFIVFSSLKMLYLMSLDDEKIILKLEGHKDTIMRALFNRDGKSLISCSLDNTIRIWKIPFLNL
jgi:WD40 repeat protein